jgi:phosphate-selective porin
MAVRNICKVLGNKAVGNSTATLWFGRFKEGDTSLRNKNAKNKQWSDEKYQRVLVDQVNLKKQKGILFGGEDLRGNMTTIDGRIGYSLSWDDNSVAVTDFFHGKTM